MDGHSSTRSTGVFAGAVAWSPAGGVINQHGWAVTDTARLLALPPLPPPRTAWYVWIGLLTMYCLCWGVAGIAFWPDSPTERSEVSPAAAAIAPTVFAAPGLIALVLVVAGLIRLSRKDRVRRRVAPYVARIHGQSWYCGRCGGVFFRPGTVPAHVQTNVLIPAANFRDTVWLHGYHHWCIEHTNPASASAPADGGR